LRRRSAKKEVSRPEHSSLRTLAIRSKR